MDNSILIISVYITYIVSVIIALLSVSFIIKHRRFNDLGHILLRMSYVLFAGYEFSVFDPSGGLKCCREFLWVGFGAIYFLYVLISMIRQDNKIKSQAYNYGNIGEDIEYWDEYKLKEKNKKFHIKKLGLFGHKASESEDGKSITLKVEFPKGNEVNLQSTFYANIHVLKGELSITSKKTETIVLADNSFSTQSFEIYELRNEVKTEVLITIYNHLI